MRNQTTKFPTALLLLLWTAILPADDEFPKPFNTEPQGEEGPMPAAEAAKGFELPDGFEVSVFASEPDVQNPIAMAWDAKGRMWVAENYTYGSRKVRFQMGLRDRVLVFEDADNDGVADKRTVFTDNVQMLTSVEVGRGGVWLMCPPNLLFIPDEDGDLVPDGEPVTVLDGFTVGQSNYHNFANGLRWGPDGWLYGRCGHSCPGRLGVPGTPDEERVPMDGGVWRYHPEKKLVEVLCHGTVNPWGHDWDAHGEMFYINTVIGHLWHVIPGAHYKESSGQSINKNVFDRIDQHADHYHYDKNQNWTKSRGGAANDYGGGHSHIGMVIYQADHLPDYWQGKLLTWNQHGRRANVERLERRGSGYVGKREPDVFLAGDDWFRGLDIRTGPDGALFGLDWSDTGECHEHTGVHRTSGRIYKFTHGAPAKPNTTIFEAAGDDVEKFIRHPNVWYYRQWLQRISYKGKELPRLGKMRERLEEFVGDKGATTAHRLRALWALNVTGGTDLVTLLDDPDEHIRVWAIRLLSDDWPLDTILGPIPSRTFSPDPRLVAKFVSMAASDKSGLVRLALASTLQRLPEGIRPGLAKALVAREEDAGDHNLPYLVWFGLTPLVQSNPQALIEVAGEARWPGLLRWTSRSLGIQIAERPQDVESLLELAASNPDRRATPILEGLVDALGGWRSAPKPENWDKVAVALGESEHYKKLGPVFGDKLALEQLKAIAIDAKAELPARQAALSNLIARRPDDLRETCEQLLSTRRLNMIAVRGLALSDDPKIGELLAGEYSNRFQPEERPPVVDVLASRPGWSRALLEKVEAGSIPASDLTPFHARQIQGFGDDSLTALLHKVWGSVTKSDAEKEERVKSLTKQLTGEALAEADLVTGRILYKNICSSCHKLYGEGSDLGPDLTGSGRAHLDYLLENIVAPSAVIPAGYSLTNITLRDGRTVGGIVLSEDEKSLTLGAPTGNLVVETSQIAKREALPQSIMPEGLIDVLTKDQVRDLIAYLMHPKQVPLPD